MLSGSEPVWWQGMVEDSPNVEPNNQVQLLY
jgi:hypothetical protein